MSLGPSYPGPWGLFLRNPNWILLVSGVSGHIQIVFSNNYLLAVGQIESQSGNIGEGSLLHSSEAGETCERGGSIFRSLLKYIQNFKIFSMSE